MTINIIAISIPLIMLLGGVIARILEAKDWNHGYCPRCNAKWVKFDTDSQGGRGYKCKKCGNGTWISYSVDRIRAVKIKNKN